MTTHTNLLNSHLLVISHHYNTFIKDQLELISGEFADICVLARRNPLSRIVPSPSVVHVDSESKHSNISVLATPVLYLPMDNEYKRLGERHFRVVEKIINKKGIEFDLIHSHFTWSAGYVGARLKELYHVPFIVTAHGYDIYDLPFRDEKWRKKIEYVLNAADAVITVSNGNRECIKKLNVATPVKVIPNGFRSDLFYPRDKDDCRRKLNLPCDARIILTVGNLVEVKGHSYLIEAMAEVIRQKKNALCLIIGGDELKSKLERRIKALGLNDNVKLLDGKPHHEIPIWMNACDLFVLPSLRESFGVVQIEAMACGKAVVATRNGGSEEIVTSEDYGILCEPGNSQELAQSILIALDKEWDSNRILEYVKQYDWKNSVTQIMKIYEDVCNKKVNSVP